MLVTCLAREIIEARMRLNKLLTSLFDNIHSLDKIHLSKLEIEYKGKIRRE
jgi:hypothetical protein